MGLFSHKAGAVHTVEIHDVRPLPDDPDQYPPYFVALCSCDKLFPEPTDDLAEAQVIADKHVAKKGGTVAPGLRRPVG